MNQDRRRHRHHLTRVVVYTILLITVLGMVLAVIGSALTPPARATQQGQEQSSPVVVLGTTGTSWGDLTVLARSTSPQADAARELLTAFGSQQSVNLVQRTTGERTCPADAWMTLGAGARTRAVPSGAACAWPRDWPQAVLTSQGAGYGARPGTLADALSQSGASTLAVGQGAELALTGSDGTVPHTATDLAQAVSTGLADLTVVDLGEASPQAVLEVLSLLPEQARVIVASLADPASPGPLMAVLPTGTSGAGGSGTQGTQLVSPTTHQDGLVQVADLSATLSLALAGQVPSTMTGGALVLPETGAGGLAGTSRAPAAPGAGDDQGGTPEVVLTLVDDALRANASQRSTAGVGVLVTGCTLLLLIGAAWLLRGREGRSRLRRTAQASLLVSALPLGAWLASLVPWWRPGAHGDLPSAWCVLSACTVSVVLALLLAGTCYLVLRTVSPKPLRAVALVIGAGVAGVILADGASGARLALNGTMGMNTVVAGRFYGMSNTAFALASGALLVTLAALVGPWAQSHPRRRVAATAGVLVPGAVAVLLDALPGTGADVGGAITLVASLVALAVGLAGDRLSWRRQVVLGVGSLSTAGALGLIDHANGSRTHMGRFITQLQDGSAATTLRRKATAGIAPFLSSPTAVAALLVGLVAIGSLAWWIRREVLDQRSGRSAYAGLTTPDPGGSAAESVTLLPPWFVPAARALGVLVVVEVLVNDSGASMAVLSAASAVPMLIALVTARLSEATH